MKAFNAVVRMVTIGVLMAIAGSAAAQQTYPSKPIRIISPYPPGGTTDIMARLFGQKLGDAWGQQVIVENRPGGNTVIGSETLVKSPPDGYTLLCILTSHVIVPNLVRTPYDPVKDFAAVATVARTEPVLVVHPSVPANNLRELIALAKSRPGELNYGSGGSGTSTHLTGEFFNLLAGIKTQHIPYKGSAPALADLIGGQVQLYFSPPIVGIPHIKSGRLKAIAVSGEKRLSALPQVPTFDESGLHGFEVGIWYGLLAPAATPRAIIDKLSSEITKILATPEIKQKLVSQGMEPFVSTPDQFAALIKAEQAKFVNIIKTANIKLEN